MMKQLSLSLTLSLTPVACDEPETNSGHAEMAAEPLGSSVQEASLTRADDTQVLVVPADDDEATFELVAQLDSDPVSDTFEGLDLGLADGVVETGPRSMTNKLLGTSRTGCDGQVDAAEGEVSEHLDIVEMLEAGDVIEYEDGSVFDPRELVAAGGEIGDGEIWLGNVGIVPDAAYADCPSGYLCLFTGYSYSGSMYKWKDATSKGVYQNIPTSGVNRVSSVRDRRGRKFALRDTDGYNDGACFSAGWTGNLSPPQDNSANQIRIYLSGETGCTY